MSFTLADTLVQLVPCTVQGPRWAVNRLNTFSALPILTCLSGL